MAAGGVLEVILVDSEGIRERRFLSCIACFHRGQVRKPFVTIEYGRKEQCTSDVAQGKGKKSIWNQRFSFNVEKQDMENHAYNNIVFHVKDKHKLSGHDDYVGETKVFVKELIARGMEVGKAELETRKYRVVRPDKSYTGDISLAITFKRKDGKDENMGGWRESMTPSRLNEQPTML